MFRSILKSKILVTPFKFLLSPSICQLRFWHSMVNYSTVTFWILLFNWQTQKSLIWTNNKLFWLRYVVMQSNKLLCSSYSAIYQVAFRQLFLDVFGHLHMRPGMTPTAGDDPHGRGWPPFYHKFHGNMKYIRSKATGQQKKIQ